MNDRRLSFGRLLLKTHELYWDHFLTFVGLLAIPHLPAALPFLIPEPLRRGGGEVGLALLGLAWGLVYLIAWTALIWAIGAAMRGEEVAVTSALAHVPLRVLGRLVWTYLLATCLFALMAIAAMILFGLIGAFTRTVTPLVTLLIMAILGATVWWFIRLLFLPQVVVLEEFGGWAAVARSGELVKGRWLRVFLVWLLFTVLEAAVTWALSHLPVLRYLAGLLVAPIGAIWVTLLYYERVDAQLLLPASALRTRGVTPRLG